MPIPRTEQLSSGNWRGVATIGSRRRTKVFPTEGEALVWADTEMRQLAKASSVAAVQAPGKPVIRLADYVPVYLASRSLEPGTISNYRAHLRPAVVEFGASTKREHAW